MSTAYYPQGMRTMPAGGRMNASFPSQYTSWKGKGIFSNPIGIAPSHVRPLTNKDSGNVFKSGSYPSRYPQNTRTFLPRPLKQYRRGRVIPSTEIQNPIPDNNVAKMETDLINYNMNRYVKSSQGFSVGNGRFGHGLVSYIQDMPGGYTVKENEEHVYEGINMGPCEYCETVKGTHYHSNVDEIGVNKASSGEMCKICMKYKGLKHSHIEKDKLNQYCKPCEGVGVVVDYMPTTANLTDNPEPKSQTPTFCCNEQYKAKRRSIYASTNLKRGYYNSHFQYMQNRCKTYKQRIFNFQDNKVPITQHLINLGFTPEQIASAKPGSALSQLNVYEANCYPNAEIFEATEYAIVQAILNKYLSKGLINLEEYTDYTTVTIVSTFKSLFDLTRGFSDEYINEANKILFENLKLPSLTDPSLGNIGPLNSRSSCKRVIYKPNNPQFAKQGAVSSSTRLLKLTVDTISTNAASMNNNTNIGSGLYTANELYRGNNNYVANLYKNKSQEKCNAPPPALIQGVYPYQNKKQCSYKNKLPEYRVPISQPSPYRNYIGTVFPSGHYTQMPRTYQNPSK
jgi:hypothetical protein